MDILILNNIYWHSFYIMNKNLVFFKNYKNANLSKINQITKFFMYYYIIAFYKFLLLYFEYGYNSTNNIK